MVNIDPSGNNEVASISQGNRNYKGIVVAVLVILAVMSAYLIVGLNDQASNESVDQKIKWHQEVTR
jgi:hypothetical protein